MSHTPLRILTLAALLASTTPAFAQYYNSDVNVPGDVQTAPLPQEQQVGDITFITGGFGDEERDLLKSNEGSYNLRIMSADVSGEFTGDTQITILSRTGEQLLVSDAGPIFYANLPAGRYTVQAISLGQIRKQNINIIPGKAQRLHFSWK